MSVHNPGESADRSVANGAATLDATGQGGRRRVLLFVNSVAVGGMEEHVELLARYLDRNRLEVFAIAPTWQATAAFSSALSEFADHAAEVTPDRRHGVARQVVELWRLFAQLKRWRIEVMHMHSTTYRGQHLALMAAKLAGVRTIYVTEHLAPDERLPLLERASRNLFTVAASGIVCVSQKNFMARKTHIFTPEEKTLVVENGVDVGDFPPVPAEQLDELVASLSIPPGAKIVGTVVRFEPEKGLDDLLNAFPAVLAACPEAILLLVGDGSLRGALERQAADLGIQDAVRFVGFQRNPRPYLGLMDVFVLPVPVGSMSIGLLEAMAMSRAVVITFGGEGEAVEHGISGYCAEPRNPASIAKYVGEILRDDVRQHSFGAAARRRVEEHFSAQRVARVLGDLYLNGMPARNARR